MIDFRRLRKRLVCATHRLIRRNYKGTIFNMRSFSFEYFFLSSGHREHRFAIHLHDKETWEIDVEMDPIRRILTFSHRSSTCILNKTETATGYKYKCALKKTCKVEYFQRICESFSA